MNVQKHINEYIASQAEPKRSDMQAVHARMLQLLPGCKLWYLDGRNDDGKIVANPNIGYGSFTINYANGSTKDFFQIGLSANKTGISVYVLGLDDKEYLVNTFGKEIGKASVTGYCIKFKKLKDINLDVLDTAIRYGAAATNDNK